MSNMLACYQLLELSVISAQDLAMVGRSMRTYAVAWIDPDRKLSTRVDSQGGTNPAWNENFVFRVDENFLYDDESEIAIDIYALHWFRDIHVGTAHVLINDLIPPPSQPSRNAKPMGMRFLGVQVRRPSGRPKGIINIGVAIIDSSKRSMPLYTHNNNNTPILEHSRDQHNHPSHQAKPELRRTKSDTSSMVGSELMAQEHRTTKSKNQASSMSGSDVKATPKKDKKLRKRKKKLTTHDKSNDFNATQHLASPRINVGYEVKSSPRRELQNYNNNNNNNNGNNGYKGGVRATPLHAFAVTNAALEYGTPYRSNMGHRLMMTDSELGPSASEVAAAVARQPVVVERENSSVGGWSLDDSVEGLQPKVERWQTELPPVYDGSEISSMTVSSKKGKHSRRHTTGGGGGNGLFSCFSVICGVECSIVCGGGSKKNRRRRVQSCDNESFL